MYLLYLRLNMVSIAGVFQHFLEFEEDCVPKRELALAVAFLLRQKQCREKYIAIGREGSPSNITKLFRKRVTPPPSFAGYEWTKKV